MSYEPNIFDTFLIALELLQKLKMGTVLVRLSSLQVQPLALFLQFCQRQKVGDRASDLEKQQCQIDNRPSGKHS